MPRATSPASTTTRATLAAASVLLPRRGAPGRGRPDAARELLREGDWSALAASIRRSRRCELDTGGSRSSASISGADMGVVLARSSRASARSCWPSRRGRRSTGGSTARRGSRCYDALLTSWASIRTRPTRTASAALCARHRCLAHAGRSRQRARLRAVAARAVRLNVLLLMAHDDEVAHNAGTEALASALGATSGRRRAALRSSAWRPKRCSPGVKRQRQLRHRRRRAHARAVRARPGDARRVGPRQRRVRLRAPLVGRSSRATSRRRWATRSRRRMRQVAFFFESFRACAGRRRR